MEPWEEAILVGRLKAGFVFIVQISALIIILLIGWFFTTHKAVIGGTDHNQNNDRFTIDQMGFEPK